MTNLKGIKKFIKLELNQINESLTFPLLLVKEKRDSSIYRFEKINERIHLEVSFDEAEIWYHYNEGKSDWLYDFSLSVEKDTKGNLFCTEYKSPKFRNEEELYSHHILKEIKILQKEKFRKESFVIYYKDKKKDIYFSKIIKERALYLELKKKTHIEIISIERVCI